MKKALLQACVVAVIALAVIISLARSGSLSRADPHYVPVTGTIKPDSYLWLQYDFLSSSPFEGGKMWILTGATNHWHEYLLDIEQRKILGELVGGEPIFMNFDQTRVLCEQRARAETNALLKVIKMFSDRIFHNRSITTADMDPETFWIVDLQRNQSTPIGRAYQFPGVGSSFHPSPKFRYGYNKPPGSSAVFICDLQSESYRQDAIDGDPVGWWDDTRFVINTPNFGAQLYDVETRKTSPLVPLSALQSLFAANGLTNRPGQTHPFAIWNNHTNEFYLSEGDNRWAAKESYLIKIERPNGALRLIDPHFKYEWSDHFDAAGRYYLYSGRESGTSNGAVYLRDLVLRQTRELAPPDLVHTNVFSDPQFYGSNVIYQRSNEIWQIGLDGQNRHRLFPPD